jgi:hypothetical protein
MVTIDASGVPTDKLSHPDFLALKAEMEAALSRPAWVNAFCVHEAGHMIYFEQLGVTKFTFAGPRIIFKPPNTFDGMMAMVKPDNVPAITGSNQFQNNLNIAARAYVAGRVFTYKLTDAPDAGEEEDRRNFTALCKAVEKSFGLPTGMINVGESWENAESEVLIDLRSPEFRAKAWAVARKIRNEFGF